MYICSLWFLVPLSTPLIFVTLSPLLSLRSSLSLYNLIQIIATMGGIAGFMYRQLTFTPKPLLSDISLSSKTALITGGNASLRLEAAKEMAAHNLSRVILGNRTLSKGEAAKEDIISQSPNCELLIWELDQESFPSIQASGERAARELDHLDIVLLCAGVKLLEFVKSKTGHEMNVQVYYFR